MPRRGRSRRSSRRRRSRGNNCGRCNTFLYPYTKKIYEIASIIAELALINPKLRWCFYFSNVPALAYIVFSFFLLFKYKDGDNLGILIVQSIVAVLLGVNNGLITYSKASSNEMCETIALGLFIFIIIIAVIIVAFALEAIYSYNISYFIITLVLFGLVFNVIGFLLTIVGLMFVLLPILLIFELLICPFKELWSCLCSRSKLRVTYYDKNKTKATRCPICLQDYKDGEAIYEGKCDVSHTAHEKCMLNWLESKETCPSCREPIK